MMPTPSLLAEPSRPIAMGISRSVLSCGSFESDVKMSKCQEWQFGISEIRDKGNGR